MITPEQRASATAVADQVHASETESLRELLALYNEMIDKHGEAFGHAHFVIYLADAFTLDAAATALCSALYILRKQGGIQP